MDREDFKEIFGVDCSQELSLKPLSWTNNPGPPCLSRSTVLYSIYQVRRNSTPGQTTR
jgi:hypothetical protein